MTKLQENKLRDMIRKEIKSNPKLLKEFAIAGGMVGMKPVNTFTSRYADSPFSKKQLKEGVDETTIEDQINAIFENEGIDVESFSTLKEGCNEDTEDLEKMESYMKNIKKLSRAYTKLANKHIN